MGYKFNAITGSFDRAGEGQVGPTGSVSSGVGDGSETSAGFQFTNSAGTGIYYDGNTSGLGLTSNGSTALLLKGDNTAEFSGHINVKGGGTANKFETTANGAKTTGKLEVDGRVGIGADSSTVDSTQLGASLVVRQDPVDRSAYYSPEGSYYAAFGPVDDEHTKAWISIESAYDKSSAVSAGIFLRAYHGNANSSNCGYTIKNLKADNALVFSSVVTGASTSNKAVETEKVRFAADGNATFAGDVSIAEHKQLNFAGTDFYLKNNSIDNYIVSSTGDLQIHMGLSQLAIKCNQDGAVDLYFDASDHPNPKFSTTETGAKVTGSLEVSGGTSAALTINASTDSNETKNEAKVEFRYNQSHPNDSIGYIKLVENDLNSFDGHLSFGVPYNNSGTPATHDEVLKLNSDKTATFAGTVTCTSLTETSDIALKTNIEPITNVLDKINQITGYKYDFTSSNSSSMGVIAQDVEKVFPELVHGEEGSKSLQYSGLIGALIESVKELSSKVAALESA